MLPRKGQWTPGLFLWSWVVLGPHKTGNYSHRLVLASLVSGWCLCGGCDPHLLLSPSSSILPPSLVLHWVGSHVAVGSVLDQPETQGSWFVGTFELGFI